MTESARLALVGLRDLSTLQWYVVPLLVLLFYVYVVEIRSARSTGNWDAVIAGVTLFSADFVNESINGWIFAISGYSALWLAPGPTALRTLVGWNVEIMFMFAIVGIVYYKSIDEDRAAVVLGMPNRWFWALFYSAVSVVIELGLNKGGLLVWDYRWWNRGLIEVLPIFVFGYLWFYLAAKYAIERPTLRGKIMVPTMLFGIAVVLNVIGLGLLGWMY
ncbi:MAG: hypothetical protein NDI84_00375 [Steroidobacteraceae bacterium]|nr:hypothetical protein [Steroidobacteraceae bacterium]